MEEVFDYVKSCMIAEKSPAEEVLVVDGTICVRVDNVLLGIKIEPIKLEPNKLEKKVEKKDPAKKKGTSKKKKSTPKKPTEEKPSP